MSNFDLPPPMQMSYESVRPHGNARVLLLLAGIFTLVTAGLDYLYAIVITGYGIFFATVTIPTTGPGVTPPPFDFQKVLPPILLGLALLSASVATLKLIAGIKLLRGSSRAWGWGLAAGIAGCTQIWCSYFCLIPLAVGIFTIVVLCLNDTRVYLSTPRSTNVNPPVPAAPGSPPPGSYP